VNPGGAGIQQGRGAQEINWTEQVAWQLATTRQAGIA